MDGIIENDTDKVVSTATTDLGEKALVAATKEILGEKTQLSATAFRMLTYQGGEKTTPTTPSKVPPASRGLLATAGVAGTALLSLRAKA